MTQQVNGQHLLGPDGKPLPVAKCIAWSDKTISGAPICGEVIPAGRLFCDKDWKLVSHGVRQAIIQEQNRLRTIGAREPSHEIQMLLQVAVKQNLDARCAADPELARKVMDFAEQVKRAQAAAKSGLIVPGGERFGIPGPEKT